MSIYNSLRADDEEGKKDFFLANALEHSRITHTFLSHGLEQQAEPITDGDFDDDEWLRIHNDRHQAEITLLGLQQYSVDLESVDADDEFSLSDWMQRHSEIHLLVNATLGLT